MCYSVKCRDEGPEGERRDAWETMIPPESRSQWPDLKRQIGYIAEKHAEREHAESTCPPIRADVPVQMDGDELVDEPLVTCSLSCETGSEGGPEEQGHRSHADGAWRLMRRMGIRSLAAIVRVGLERRRPLEYRMVDLTRIEIQSIIR